MKDEKLALYGGDDESNKKGPEESGPGSLVPPMERLKDAIASIGSKKK